MTLHECSEACAALLKFKAQAEKKIAALEAKAAKTAPAAPAPAVTK